LIVFLDSISDQQIKAFISERLFYSMGTWGCACGARARIEIPGPTLRNQAIVAVASGWAEVDADGASAWAKN